MRLLLVGLALGLLACSTAPSEPLTGVSACPASVPEDMSPCGSVPGPSCEYDCAAGHGIDYVAHCSNSIWVVVGRGIKCPACTSTIPETCDAAGVPISCPPDIPTDKDPCDSSSGEAKCSYDCAVGHGTSFYATCTNSAWSVFGLGTACPPCTTTLPETCEAGIPDAADAATE